MTETSDITVTPDTRNTEGIVQVGDKETNLEGDTNSNEQTNTKSAAAGRIPLQATVSTIKRDAATYGVDWKPPRSFTFWSPQQAKQTHLIWLKILGRVGWIAKGIVYALIGGLACDNAVGNKDSSASPQGAFVLIGTTNGGRGALIVLAIAIATYSVWRFWEGIVGQGYDDTFGNMRNFFKFRLSPIVSGAVYVAYDVLVIEVIPRDDDSQREFISNSTWPNSWHDSGIGKAGLILVGIGFLAAVIVQLEQFFTKSFHNTLRREFPYMKKRLWKPFRIFVLVCGHIGVLGRAGIFLFAAILFFRTVRTKDMSGKSAFGNAFAQLQASSPGCAALFITGFFVIIYGLFAVLNAYARIFPTPPPSGIPKKRQYKSTGGEQPLGPQFSPGESGFHPMRGPSTRHLEASSRLDASQDASSRPRGPTSEKASRRVFCPMSNKIAEGGSLFGVTKGYHKNDSDIETGSS